MATFVNRLFVVWSVIWQVRFEHARFLLLYKELG